MTTRMGDGSGMRDMLIKGIQRTVHSSAQASNAVGTAVKTPTISDGDGTLVNDEGMCTHAKRVGEEMLGEANVLLSEQIMGAEDFSFYGQKFPSAVFMIGTRNETLGAVHHLHSPYFFLDEEALPVGAALHAAVAISYLDLHS